MSQNKRQNLGEGLEKLKNLPTIKAVRLKYESLINNKKMELHDLEGEYKSAMSDAFQAWANIKRELEAVKHDSQGLPYSRCKSFSASRMQ